MQTNKHKKISFSIEEIIQKEKDLIAQRKVKISKIDFSLNTTGIYDWSDIKLFIGEPSFQKVVTSLKTLDELLEKDKQREKDGFPKRIRIGKFIKPSADNKEKIIVVPTTTEPKFYHDDSLTEEGTGEGQTGGSGDGEEGEVIGEQPADQQGEGDAQGAGQGSGEGHDITSDAFDLGKMLTEKFELPNLKTKGKKVSFNKYQYDLTDRHRGFGQLLDKKATIKKIIQTNILLDRIKEGEIDDLTNLVVNPQDQIYRILSKEKDFEAQAVVFFIRDYSGSMQGKPTEAVVTQHLLIYSWLMFQYQNNVKVRFILHDTEAKEVPDFYTYYRSAVAGGTSIYPSYQLVNEIVYKEQLIKDNNIYVFHGTDGDDWEENGEQAVEEIKKILQYVSRMGITVAKNSWTGPDKTTVVENYINKSGLLKEKSSLLKLDSFSADDVTEERLIKSIKELVS